MAPQTAFGVLTFIVILAIILLMGNLSSAVLIMSLIVNFFVLSKHFGDTFKIDSEPQDLYVPNDLPRYSGEFNNDTFEPFTEVSPPQTSPQAFGAPIYPYNTIETDRVMERTDPTDPYYGAPSMANHLDRSAHMRADMYLQNQTVSDNERIPPRRDELYTLGGRYIDNKAHFDADPVTGMRYGYSIDDRVQQMARSRERSKTAIDGSILKTADYYKYNFGNEFVENERAPWWGETDL